MQDSYFMALYTKAAKLFANNLFSSSESEQRVSEKEIKDLLRFADILSNSKKTISRNNAYKVITLLNQEYKTNSY
jgi:hypothetical protein